MGKNIWEDKEAWKEALRKNYKAVQKMDPTLTDEQIEAKIEVQVNDTKKIELYQKVQKFNEIVKNKMAIQTEYKNEYKAAHNGKEPEFNGLSSNLYSMLDVSGTPEAKKRNWELMDKFTDRKYAMKFIMDTYKKLTKLDYSKFAVKTAEEALDLYEKNYDEITELFVVDRMFNQLGAYTQDPEFVKFFKRNKTLMEGTNNLRFHLESYEKVGFLTIPDVDPMIAFACSKYFEKNNAELIGKFDGFVGVPGTEDKTGKFTKEQSVAVALGNNIKIATVCEESYKEYSLFKDGKLPENFVTDYKCMIDGKEVTHDDALVQMTKDGAGKKVDIVKLTNEEIEARDRAFDYALLDDPAMNDSLDNLYNLGASLKAADHWYNWNNSKEYDNLLKGINDLKNIKGLLATQESFKENIKKVSDLAQKYVDKYQNVNKSGIRLDRFNICNDIIALNENVSKENFWHKIEPLEPVAKENLQVREPIEVDLGEQEEYFEKSFELDMDNPEALKAWENDEIDIH